MPNSLKPQKQSGDDDALLALGLRPATPGDESFLRNLFASTRAKELAAMIWDEAQKQTFVAMQFNAQSWQYETSYPHAEHSIILLNEAPIGRLLLDRGEGEFTLVDIALLAEYRNAGIGTGLIQRLLEEAADAGKPVRLHVFNSSPAMRLYARLGFSRVGADAVYVEMIWLPPVKSH